MTQDSYQIGGEIAPESSEDPTCSPLKGSNRDRKGRSSPQLYTFARIRVDKTNEVQFDEFQPLSVYQDDAHLFLRAAGAAGDALQVRPRRALVLSSM